MSYAQGADPGSRATAVVTVVAVHAGLAALLLYGLATNGVIRIEDGPLVTTQFTPPPPPPPPDPTPTQKAKPSESTPAPRPYVPDAAIPLAPIAPIPTSGIIVDPGPIATDAAIGEGSGLGKIDFPTPSPSYDPVPPRPANDASGWITQSDYRTPWINRGWEGTASYRLSIGTDGKVKQCSITRPTGHDAMDEATCALVSKRAKFKPATGSNGGKVAGSYTGSVRWVLPR